MNNLRYRYQQFMRNRYGIDDLSRFLLWTAIIFNLLSTFFRSLYVLPYISLILLGIIIYRTFSRNIVKRSMENQKFRPIKNRVVRSCKVFYRNLKDRQYHYYLCPSCAQIVRVPRGKGSITITCPNCHNHFDKKS